MGAVWRGSNKNNHFSSSPALAHKGVKQVTLLVIHFKTLPFVKPVSQTSTHLGFFKGFPALVGQIMEIAFFLVFCSVGPSSALFSRPAGL